MTHFPRSPTLGLFLGVAAFAGSAHALDRIAPSPAPLPGVTLVGPWDDDDRPRRRWRREEEEREPRGWGGGGECSRAREASAQTQNSLNIATYNLTVLDRLCGRGNFPCITNYQSLYNQWVVRMDKARHRERFACGG